jgi:hypothetical protein
LPGFINYSEVVMALTVRQQRNVRFSLMRILARAYDGQKTFPLLEGGMVFKEVATYHHIKEDEVRQVAKDNDMWPYDHNDIDAVCQERAFPSDADGSAQFLADPFGSNY